jgi:drug/metabolite transporter (DMT)-like permease
MSWQVLISLQVVLVAFATIVTRFLARDRKLAGSGMAITAGWFCFLYLFGLIALTQIGGVDISAFQQFGWRFAGGGLAFALSNILVFYMFVYLDAAIGTILGTLAVIFTVFGASLILRENLSNLQIIGTCLLLISVIYGTLATRHRKDRLTHVKLAIGAAYALGGSIFYSIATINEKSLLSHVSVGSYIFFGWGFEMLGAMLVVLSLQPRSLIILLKPSVLGWTFFLGFLRAVSGLCFMLSLIRSNNAGLVTVISSFKLIIIVLLGAWLLNERSKLPQKLTAAAIAMVALTLLFWY